jgi:hypothetical protein
MSEIFNFGDALANTATLIDYLTYCNYRFNRKRSPQISVERWEKIYGPSTKEMESRFQREECAA